MMFLAYGRPFLPAPQKWVGLLLLPAGCLTLRTYQCLVVRALSVEKEGR